MHKLRRTKKLVPGYCPHCGAFNKANEANSLTFCADLDAVEKSFVCQKCFRRWQEYYSLSYSGFISDFKDSLGNTHRIGYTASGEQIDGKLFFSDM